MPAWTADDLYGPDPTAQQPTDTTVPEHAASGRPEPVAKTIAGHNLSMAHSPGLAVAILLGVALVLLSLVNR